MPKSLLKLIAGFSVIALLATAPLWAKNSPANGGDQSTQMSEAEGSDTFKQLTLFSDVLERVRADYVDPVTDDKLIEAAVNGMLSSLDPHSGYLNKKSFQDMQTQTKGEFGGLGIEVTMENSLVKVVSPIDDTPAAKAGIQPNDLITHIDNQPVTELTLNEAVDKMRGTPGTKITLTIRRGGINGQPFDVTLTRAVIHIQSVRWQPEKDVAYIRITAFNEQTQTGLDKALEEADKQIGDKLIGYVIDLRNNPGGLLEQAVSVSGTFLEAGKEVVSTHGRHKEEDQTYTAKGGDKAHGKPIVIIINGGSASASEIVAGALQDQHRAIVIGTKSFGKGSVQTIIPVAGGGAMRLTTARYYTPSGRSIQKLGIEPDIVVQQAKLEKVANGPGIREADLKGALQNDTIKAQDKDKKTDDQSDDEGIESSPDQDKSSDKSGDKDKDKAAKKDEPFDYQLARALDLIRGVHLFEAKKG
jgi:carboxyl-terminal processing protease